MRIAGVVLLAIIAFAFVCYAKQETILNQDYDNNEALKDINLYYDMNQTLGALPCGREMTSLYGIGAYPLAFVVIYFKSYLSLTLFNYSNGPNQGTGYSCGGTGKYGYRFQCVEFAQRFFSEKHGVAPIWPVSYALQMCKSRPAGTKIVGTPSDGDLMVFNWPPYGHVAVIDKVEGNSIHVVEQNGAASGRQTYQHDQALCFIAH